MDYNVIIQGDVMEEMRKLPDGGFRGVITSPPYNLRNSTGNGMKPNSSGKWKNAALQDGYDDYDDAMPHVEYVKWQRQVLRQCMRVTADDGAIFYNHKWRVQKGLIQDRADILNGFPVRQIIIWKRSGGFNFNPGYFVPTYEVIYLIAKKKFKLAKGMNALGDVWEIPQETNNEHPAPFPLELATRCVRALGNGPVLDPFMGSGTTALAASKENFPWFGIERSQRFIDQAYDRLIPQDVESIDPSSRDAKLNRKKRSEILKGRVHMLRAQDLSIKEIALQMNRSRRRIEQILAEETDDAAVA